jgi:hypothetical protein
VPKEYAAGLEKRCPGGACFKLERWNPQQPDFSNGHAISNGHVIERPTAEAVTGSQLICGNLDCLPNEKLDNRCPADVRAPAGVDRGRAWIAKMHSHHTRPSRIAFAALIAQMLCACSGDNSAARYPDLNASPPTRESSTDPAQTIAELLAARDNSERAAARQGLQ